MGDLAYVFHFQPSELWNMDAGELMMWYDQAERIHEKLGNQHSHPTD